MSYETDCAPPPVMGSTVSASSVGRELAGVRPASPVSATWPAARRIIYVPFRMGQGATARKLWWANGATASGNVQAGIYASSRGLPTIRIQGTSATRGATADVAQAGTTDLQEFDMADVYLPGFTLYFWALTMDGTAGTCLRWNTMGLRLFGIAIETPGTFGLPTTATPVTAGTNEYVPLFGVAFRTLVA